MCSKGFEPPTHGLEGRCSIQLSYEHTTVMRIFHNKAGDGNRTHVSSLEGWCSTIELHPHIIGVTGFEPATSWSQTRRSSQAEPHPVFFCASLLSYPRRKNYYMASRAFCQQLFSTFFKNFSNPCKPFIYAALRVLRILEYPSISQKFSAKLKSVPTFFPKKTMHLNPYSSK